MPFQVKHCADCGELLEEEEDILCSACKAKPLPEDVVEYPRETVSFKDLTTPDIKAYKEEMAHFYHHLFKEIEELDKCSHEQMCYYWRFGKGKQIWFDSTSQVSRYFKYRLFVFFEGFNPQISKQLGFTQPEETPYD